MSGLLKFYSKNGQLLKPFLCSCPTFRNKRTAADKKRAASKRSYGMKVAIIGAAGAVGQPLAMMLKQSHLIDHLALHDIVAMSGFAMELDHIDTKCKVSYAKGYDLIGEVLEGARVVVITAAKKKSSADPKTDVFEPNARIIKEVTCAIVSNCPQALVAIVTNPVNSLVPVACQLLRRNKGNPASVFGVTTLNSVRANTFVAQVMGLEPECVFVPIIGGHTDKTVVPILSQAKPCSNFTIEELESLTRKIQSAGTEVSGSKVTKGNPTLSCAFASARFVISLVKGLLAKPNIVETAYVESKVHTQVNYLATPLQLGLSGIQRNLGLPELTEYESCLLEQAIPKLNDDIKKAEYFLALDKPIDDCTKIQDLALQRTTIPESPDSICQRSCP